MTSLQTIVVPEGASAERADRFLARQLGAASSRTEIKRWMLAGLVCRGGRPLSPDASVRVGDLITIAPPPHPTPRSLAPEPVPLDILYEDDALLILNKPAGLVVHPGAGHARGTLAHGLVAHTAQLSQMAGALKPGIVHRLDKETSGIMVVAKNDLVHRAVAKQFADRTVRRTYVALVGGVISRDRGVIEAALGRHPKHRQRIAVRPAGQGREAITGYRVLRRFHGATPHSALDRAGVPRSGATLVELTPQTGRTHQLRVHLAHLGFPILGDRAYGRPGAGLTRQALHAWRLGFLHPTTGEFVEFTAPWPSEFTEAMRRLAKN